MPDPTSHAKTATDAESHDAEPVPGAAAAHESDEQRADGTIEAEVTEAPSTDRTAELEAAAGDLRDRLLRAHAEMENLRRRTEREVQDARRYAVTAFARDVLGVADNLRRALEAAAGGSQPGESAQKALIEGVELTERELLRALERNGVQKLDPKGKPFDPNLHQAMFEAPDASVPAGTVVQVIQDGYVISDRILRPAMVGVARGAPKGGESAPAEEAAEPSPNIDRKA